MFCSCFGRKRKTSEIACDTDVAPKDVQQSSCETTQVEETHIPLPVLENGGTPNKVLTLNGRKLPDIPHYEYLGRNWDPAADTSLDITRPHSQNAVEQRLPRTDPISKNAPNSQSSPDLHVYELEEPLASVSLPKLDCPSPKNVQANGEDYGSNEAIRPHPYETLPGQTSDANYYEPQMYSTPAPRERNAPFSPAWYQSDSGTREAMPPLVPAKNFTEDELYETNEASSSSAATAVAGRHFSDIPYMTSPDRNSQEESVFEDSNRDLNESASSKQVISYTSISVREPIKTVLANSAAKAVSKPRARKITEEQEAVYSTVPEDADTDQTYEVIESARSSAHLNDMYAQVSKPVTATVDETREPPEPPTLESLMNVAHAHSRQTSSSSIKNFAHGQHAGDHYADTYGSRDLHPYTDTKKTRNTVHVMDTDSLDGMYAKIQKKKGGASSGGHSPTNRPSSVIIQTQPLPQEPSEPSTSRVVFRRESSTVDPMYERINGRSEDSAARSDADADAGIVGYESIRGSRNNDGGVSSSDDPGYARVVDNVSEILDPTYECLTARRSSPGSSDPGYWKIRSPEEDLGDHLYELISSRKKEEEEEEEGEEEEEEPNYDRIKSPAGNDTDEDEEEPAYEKVHQKPLPESDPGADHDSDTREVLLDGELVKDGGVESEGEDRSVNLTSKREDSSNGQM